VRQNEKKKQSWDFDSLTKQFLLLGPQMPTDFHNIWQTYSTENLQKWWHIIHPPNTLCVNGLVHCDASLINLKRTNHLNIDVEDLEVLLTLSTVVRHVTLQHRQQHLNDLIERLVCLQQQHTDPSITTFN